MARDRSLNDLRKKTDKQKKAQRIGFKFGGAAVDIHKVGNQLHRVKGDTHRDNKPVKSRRISSTGCKKRKLFDKQQWCGGCSDRHSQKCPPPLL